MNWILDADVSDFFTRLDHSWLERFPEHRIADKRVLRLIRKWLAAGVVEDGNWSETAGGSPQGEIMLQLNITPPMSSAGLCAAFGGLRWWGRW